MRLLQDMLQNTRAAIQSRVDAARAAGGVSDQELAESGLPPPGGYWYDSLTCFHVPATVDLWPRVWDL